MNANLKKFLSFLLMAFLLGLVSCKKDEEVEPNPTIADNGSTTSAGVGDTISINALVVAKAKLKSIEVRFDNRTLTTKTRFTNDESDNFTFTFFVDSTRAGQTLRFTVVAIDRKDRSANKDFSVTIRSRVAPTTPPADTTSTGTPAPLSSPQSFTWERVGSSAGTGLSEFGLAWTSNTSTAAIIRKDAQKLVKLSASQYNSITTRPALKAAIDAAADIPDFRDISVQSNRTYSDLIIGTIKNNVYYIIKIEESTVSSSSAGTRVTVKGVYRN
ncbi:MAG: hypothetical protein NZM38_10610 [Cytophagales bacterium]|nr:hypothetical protein [Cytophagales bacterium]MDW8385206.1 hypothetical protein [Flammeovirgaceae bacterium]